MRISLVIEIHNLTNLLDSRLQVYGGPHGTKILDVAHTDIPALQLELLEADVFSDLARMLDDHVGPFD